MFSYSRCFIVAMVIMISPQALACQALPISDPAEIKQLIEKAGAQGQGITAEEVVKIKSYQQDLERFHVLYNKLYPCQLELGVYTEELSSEERVAYRAEWKALDKKWGFMD